jgi:glycosyltransferase involved in cell wall biosynthesis
VNANNPEELADAVVKILNKKNVELYREIAENAFLSSKQYDIDNYIDNLEMVYSRL